QAPVSPQVKLIVRRIVGIEIRSLVGSLTPSEVSIQSKVPAHPSGNLRRSSAIEGIGVIGKKVVLYDVWIDEAKCRLSIRQRASLVNIATDGVRNVDAAAKVVRQRHAKITESMF